MILPALVCEAIIETRKAPAIKSRKIKPGTLIRIFRLSTTLQCPQHILTVGRQKPAEICPQYQCAADLPSDLTSKVNPSVA